MPRAENVFAYRIEIDPSRVQAVERLAQATERLGGTALAQSQAVVRLYDAHGRLIERTERNAQATEGATEASRRAANAFAQLGRRVGRLRGGLHGTGIALYVLGGRFTEVARGVMGLSLSMRALEALLPRIGRAFTVLSARAASAQKNMQALGIVARFATGVAARALQWAIPTGLGFGIAGGVFAMGGALAEKLARSSAEYQQTLVRTLLVAKEPLSQLGRYTWEILEASKRLRIFAPQELAQATMELVKADVPLAAAVRGVLDTVMKFQYISEVDVPTALKGLAQIAQETAGIIRGTLEQRFRTISDLIIRIADISTIDIADAFESFRRSAFILNENLGLTKEELGAIIALLPSVGMESSRAGRMMRILAQRLLALKEGRQVTAQVRFTFEKLGEAGRQALEEFRRGEIGMVEFAHRLKSAGASLADFTAIAEMRAAPALKMIAERYDEINQKARDLQDVSGMTDRFFRALTNTYQGMLQQYQASLARLGVLTELGLQPWAKLWLRVKQKAVDALIDISLLFQGSFIPKWHIFIGRVQEGWWIFVRAILQGVNYIIEGLNKLPGVHIQPISLEGIEERLAAIDRYIVHWTQVWAGRDQLRAQLEEQAQKLMAFGEAAGDIGEGMQAASGRLQSFKDFLEATLQPLENFRRLIETEIPQAWESLTVQGPGRVLDALRGFREALDHNRIIFQVMNTVLPASIRGVRLFGLRTSEAAQELSFTAQALRAVRAHLTEQFRTAPQPEKPPLTPEMTVGELLTRLGEPPPATLPPLSELGLPTEVPEPPPLRERISQLAESVEALWGSADISHWKLKDWVRFLTSRQFQAALPELMEQVYQAALGFGEVYAAALYLAQALKPVGDALYDFLSTLFGTRQQTTSWGYAPHTTLHTTPHAHVSLGVAHTGQGTESVYVAPPPRAFAPQFHTTIHVEGTADANEIGRAVRAAEEALLRQALVEFYRGERLFKEAREEV